MGFQVGRVDHQPARLASLARQFGENLVEHAKAAPAHEPIVDRLMRTVLARSIAPPQPVPDDEDDPANHPSVEVPETCVVVVQSLGGSWFPPGKYRRAALY